MEKAEKADLVMQLAFWQKCQNAIKCHKMTKCLHFGSGSCIRILFLNAYKLWNQGSYVGETHLEMTTRARAFYLIKTT